MNSPEKPAKFVPSASEYILDNFAPSDRIAMHVLHRGLGETIQRIISAEKAASPKFQAWLGHKNANGSPTAAKPACRDRFEKRKGT